MDRTGSHHRLVVVVGVDHVQRRAAPSSLLEGPLQRFAGRVRAVDAEHHPAETIRRPVGGYHDDRARGVSDAAVADRPEYEAGEATPSPCSNDEEIGGRGRFDQRLGGGRVHENGPDRGIRLIGERAGLGIEYLTRAGLEVGTTPRVVGVDGRRRPGMDDVKSGTVAAAGLLDGPASAGESAPAQLGVDASVGDVSAGKDVPGVQNERRFEA